VITSLALEKRRSGTEAGVFISSDSGVGESAICDSNSESVREVEEASEGGGGGGTTYYPPNLSIT
jgi:hypothetical protein